MYELTVEREFCAAHAITMRGEREPVHGHTWHVAAVVAGERLDDDGLVCDFHEIQSRLDAIVGRLHQRDLNATPPFDEINPTAELVARHVADGLARQLPPEVRLRRVSITESPGCTATWVADSA